MLAMASQPARTVTPGPVREDLKYPERARVLRSRPVASLRGAAARVQGDVLIPGRRTGMARAITCRMTALSELCVQHQVPAGVSPA
jgi:hypothetical protein